MPQAGRRLSHQRSELADALAACRGAFISIGLMSGMSNILMLTGAIFMLEVYDRVLPSRSVPTLVGLVILAAGLYAAQGLLDLIRARILVRIGARLDDALSGRVYETIVRLPLKVGNRADGLQPLRDLDAVRAFLSGAGPNAMFDLPWLPIYLVICFLFHPYIGLAALFGAIILGIITLLTEIMTREPTRAATRFAMARQSLAETSRRNAEVLTAMGMTSRIASRWGDANAQYMAAQRRASDVAGGFGSASRVLRMMLQSGVLAVGAYLVIYQMATAGIIIAGSILSARALAPVDLAIANWRGFVAARQGWKRLTDLLGSLPVRTTPMELQPPCRPVARRSSFRMSALRCKPAMASASLGRAGREKARWRACWSACGSRCAGEFVSTARRSISGLRICSADTSVICRRMSSFWPARWRRTLAAFPNLSIPKP
jgi:ATP-binding cassette subfamily C protein